MKRTIGVALAALLAVDGATGAFAAGCATPGDLQALETAALQQQLMVAAFSCHAVAQYNHFVLAHRPELMDADARLKAYFVRVRGGEAYYHTYKTELANDSSLRSLGDTDGYCADADDAFEMAGDPTLSPVLDSHSWSGLLASYPACTPGVTERVAAAPRPRAQGEALDGREAGGRHVTDRGATDRAANGMSGDLAAPAPHHRIEADSL